MTSVAKVYVGNLDPRTSEREVEDEVCFTCAVQTSNGQVHHPKT